MTPEEIAEANDTIEGYEIALKEYRSALTQIPSYSLTEDDQERIAELVRRRSRELVLAIREDLEKLGVDLSNLAHPDNIQ